MPQPASPPGGTPAAASSTTQHFLGRRLPAAIPRMGLGLAALGRPGYINIGHGSDLQSRDVDAMRAHCWDVLDAAWTAGVRYFDCARSYGRAEEFLAGWLAERHIPPQAVIVGSKWGYSYTADWQVDTNGEPHEVKQHTAANLAKQADETAGHLGRYLNLYQIHSATLESGVLEAADVLQLLSELKQRRGWQMGLSVSGEQQGEVVQRALQIRQHKPGSPEEDEQPLLFSSVQATWNLLEQSAGPALQAAHNAGLQVIVKEALANGRLTERNNSPDFRGRLALLRNAASQLGASVDALALACVLAQPWQPLVLSGAASPQQLASNRQALALAARLPPALLQELSQQLVLPPEAYWAERAGLAWN